LLTHVASAALARSLRDLAEAGIIPQSLNPELKWPNDVLLCDKKTAGILLETSGTGSSVAGVVVGVGVNVRHTALPAELQDQVTCLSDVAGTDVPRRQVLVRFLLHFQKGYDLFERGEHEKILDEWKSFSHMWNEMPVWIVENAGPRPAITAGLDASGALLVRNPDGTVETILAGDVSVRRSRNPER
jgi:BirA family biotin operon repressor/biotin-[acetyl-CoA-carboxylase] ligase